MEAFWLKALEQVPGLTVVGLVLLFITRYFLRSLRQLSEDGRETINRFLEFMDDRDSRQGHRDREQATTLKTLGEACHEFQRDMADRHETLAGRVSTALDRNTDALGRNTAVLQQVEGTLEDLGRHLPSRRET